MTKKKKSASKTTPEAPVDGTVNKEKSDEQEKESTHLESSFPIVGIGASAGGLAAFEDFFSGMPSGVEPGMAFVLVQHLAPDHKSHLTEIVRRYTRMQVFEVEDGMIVKPNCTYIIPPKHDMALLNGALQLLEPGAPRGHRLPIDFFFRSLAQELGERAICIILSGSGSDGTVGMRAIKDAGGIAIAQTPESTEHDGMPLSAISTGLVDYQLTPAEMPAQLIAFVTHARNNPPLLSSTSSKPKADSALKKIHTLLRAQTGHDFSQYKPSTILRRIERRVAVNQLTSIDDYLNYLKQAPDEVEALFRNLLIGVTNFFRDPEAFKELEKQVIPALFADKPAGSAIRVWVPGCSSGEEAYSIAILLQERLTAIKQKYKVLVFATDIDSWALAKARSGLYPPSIAADIPEERLNRFFSAEADDGNVYRVNKAIRDMLVFSEQDVVKDPPFSRLDLICCRNLMIYMSSTLQKKLIPMFHYALNPNGFLFLGTSETVGEFGDLFATTNRKQKIFKRQEDMHGLRRAALRRPFPGNQSIDVPFGHVHSDEKTTTPPKLSLRELTEQALLQQVVPVAALVNSHGDILYLHGRTGLYLELAPGETGINNIVKMAREGLQHELGVALHKVVAGQEIVRHKKLLVKNNSASVPVRLTVCQVAMTNASKPWQPLFLVILEEVAKCVNEPVEQNTGSSVAGEEAVNSHAAAAKISELTQELYAKEEYLQASTEELKSSNEEMQSMNEELQSTNEELETSKEELQSINEELATVNAEMQTKMNELTRANNDINNLLAGTGIATVFVDHQQRILNFTPTASKIINLILSDVGRPIGHLVSNLVDYNGLTQDVKTVLDSLVPLEREVRTASEEWYTMRVLPYRTTENVIEGAVITFVNITDRKQTEETLQETRAILQAAMDHSIAGIAIADAPSGTLRYVNAGGLLIHGLDQHSIAGGIGIKEYVDKCHLADMNGNDLKLEEMPLFRAIMSGEKCSRELTVRKPENGDRVIIATAAPIKNTRGKVVAGVMVFMDITELREAKSNAWLSAIVNSSHDAIISRDLDGAIRSWNQGAKQMFGYSESEMLGQKIRLLFSDEQPDGFDNIDRFLHGAETANFTPYCQTKVGRRIDVQLTQSPILGENGQALAVSVTMSDISDLKEMQRQVIETNTDLEKIIAERTAAVKENMGQLRRLAHELTQTEQRERQRLANVLHNELQQILVAAGLRIERLSNTESDTAKRQAFQQIEELLMQAVTTTRLLATELRPPVLNSGNLVKSLEWLIDWLWRRFDFTLKFSVPEDFQTEDMQDESIAFLFDIARELCFNIVKHAHVKEGRMSLEKTTGNRLRLRVEDDGVGINRVQKELLDSESGGLGLQAIQDRLALFDGEMRVSSAVGNGFSVDILLPYAMKPLASQQQLPKGKRRVGPKAGGLPKGRKIRVVLADDHTVVRDGLKVILQDESDIEVVGEAVDGEEALKMVAKLQPDVVIMDVNMPNMDGIEATKLIRQAHPEISVIALSINDDPGTNKAMLESGACAYLNKSGSTDDLCRAIRTCLQKNPAPEIGVEDEEGSEDTADHSTKPM